MWQVSPNTYGTIKVEKTPEINEGSNSVNEAAEIISHVWSHRVGGLLVPSCFFLMNMHKHMGKTVKLFAMRCLVSNL